MQKSLSPTIRWLGDEYPLDRLLDELQNAARRMAPMDPRPRWSWAWETASRARLEHDIHMTLADFGIRHYEIVWPAVETRQSPRLESSVGSNW